MEKKEYSVSEAVRLVGVESHVLRYWEEELQVEIRRTSQGHRIYSQENIEMFRKVRELKEHGLQLKAIRILLDGAADGTAKAELAEQIIEIGSGAAEKRDRLSGQPQEKGKKSSEKKERSLGNARMGSQKIIDIEDKIRENQEEPPEDGQKPEQWEKEYDGEQAQADEPEPDEEELFPESDADLVYDVALVSLPGEDFDKFRQFEQIIKRIIGDVVEEKNQKLEQSLRMLLREELDQFFLQYQDMLSEAAAEREPESGRRGLFGYLRDLFGR